MIEALKLELAKPRSEIEKESMVDLVHSLDRIMMDYDIDPIIWVPNETEKTFTFSAYIPPDCAPELDKVADFLTECYRRFDQNQAPSPG